MVHSEPLPGGVPEYDICIVGSGPAGLTLANELLVRDTQARVCVLESGGTGPSAFGDSLRDLDSEGIIVKKGSRERVLGGTSATWTGRSAPLDEIDFEKRSWIRFSGWPINSDDLAPYYARAAERYRFPDPSLFRVETWTEVLQSGDVAPAWDSVTAKVFLTDREPQHFGRDLAHIFRSERVDLFLDASVVRLDGDRDSGRAHTAVVRTSQGLENRVSARFFVLACGGIENARLLLLSTYACATGLGNERDQVGRYLMNHPKGEYGTIRPRREIRELPAYFGFRHAGFAGSLGLRLADRIQRERALLNSYVRLEPVFAWTDRAGVETATSYLRSARARLARLLGRGDVGTGAVAADPAAGALDDARLGGGAPRGHARSARLIWRDRRSLGRYVIDRVLSRRSPAVTGIRVLNFMEMEPDPLNRVTLGERRDPFGSPVPAVYHQSGDLCRRTMQALHDVIREEVRNAGWGELVSDMRADLSPWPLCTDASHHMGTTRMGTDPAVSVVDENCRIHTVPNVFVAGASVFPTGGNANPTFTAVALAIRLAEHLSDLVRARHPIGAAAALPDAGPE